MKTSIDLPDSLHLKAKARAAEQGVTLGEVVVVALEKALILPGFPHGSPTNPTSKLMSSACPGSAGSRGTRP